jgi:predicted RNA-binding Zn-ribbon protein involved in translation (DUF1610 family)
MSDRKYRQRGYQDEKGSDRPKSAPRPAGPREPRLGPKTPNMPGFHEVVRCSQCGNPIGASDQSTEPSCKRCGAELHSCAQCVHFDGSARFECTQPVTARISPKDTRNTCEYFGPRVTVERQTGSAAPTDARSAFDDLFK